MQNGNKPKIQVLLATPSPDVRDLYNDLIGVLRHARADFLLWDKQQNKETKGSKIPNFFENVNSSIHIIGNKYNIEENEQTSVQEKQFFQALQYTKINPKFKLFVWRPERYRNLPNDERQRNFIFYILNHINENVIYTNHESPILLVEDLRSILTIEKSTKFDVRETEIYLIYNEIDEPSALMIKDLLSDVASVESTSISLSSDIDYDDYIAQQIQKSKLPVIYFKKATIWASYFIKEIWRKIGGISSGKTLLLIGDESNPENHNIDFSAPNVEKIITSEELIPLEIKVALDKLQKQVEV